MISSDHGENHGELNIYGDHQTADHITSRVPFILKYPKMLKPRVDKGLHYQTDIAASVLEICGCEVPGLWDGKSFWAQLKDNKEYSRGFIVVSQCAWSCQRSVVFNDWILIKTYDTGLKNFPELMLFDLENDPHETNNLAAGKPAVVKEGLALLEKWVKEMMSAPGTAPGAKDPLFEVIEEGGPYHSRTMFQRYCERLRKTGRAQFAEKLERLKGKP